MRTVDVARRAGCSVQQVRKLEAAGVLPSAPRTTSGYRQYNEQHVASVLAYQQLAAAIGPVEACLLLVDAHRDQNAMLARLDAAHARLHQERHELELARRALRSISAEQLADVEPADSMSVGELAQALGIRPSTLRHWEVERLLSPPRDRNGARSYSPTIVRDARLIHQLRQAGHRIASLRDLLPTLGSEHDWDELLTDREHSIQTRSRAMLSGTADLAALTPTAAQDPPNVGPTSRSQKAAGQS